jgi:hypothetical protein
MLRKMRSSQCSQGRVIAGKKEMKRFLNNKLIRFPYDVAGEEEEEEHVSTKGRKRALQSSSLSLSLS